MNFVSTRSSNNKSFSFSSRCKYLDGLSEYVGFKTCMLNVKYDILPSEIIFDLLLLEVEKNEFHGNVGSSAILR